MKVDPSVLVQRQQVVHVLQEDPGFPGGVSADGLAFLSRPGFRLARRTHRGLRDLKGRVRLAEGPAGRLPLFAGGQISPDVRRLTQRSIDYILVLRHEPKHVEI